MSVGANPEVDFFSRIANLELAVFGGPNPNGLTSPVPGPVTILSGSTDAIPAKSASYLINTAGVDAMTLANPVAGSPTGTVGGQDGLTIFIFGNTANAHTLTTGVHGINGNKNIATGAGAIGNALQLRAMNGQWCVIVNSGFTLSGS